MNTPISEADIVERLSYSFIDDDKFEFEEMIIWSIKERKQ
jgi:hypothetical protein